MTGDRVGMAPSYSRKVKQHFDPENRSKSKEYVDPNVGKVEEKAMFYLRPLISSKLGKFIVSKKLAKEGM